MASSSILTPLLYLGLLLQIATALPTVSDHEQSQSPHPIPLLFRRVCPPGLRCDDKPVPNKFCVQNACVSCAPAAFTADPLNPQHNTTPERYCIGAVPESSSGSDTTTDTTTTSGTGGATVGSNTGSTGSAGSQGSQNLDGFDIDNLSTSAPGTCGITPLRKACKVNILGQCPNGCKCNPVPKTSHWYEFLPTFQPIEGTCGL